MITTIRMVLLIFLKLHSYNRDENLHSQRCEKDTSLKYDKKVLMK